MSNIVKLNNMSDVKEHRKKVHNVVTKLITDNAIYLNGISVDEFIDAVYSSCNPEIESIISITDRIVYYMRAGKISFTIELLDAYTIAEVMYSCNFNRFDRVVHKLTIYNREHKERLCFIWNNEILEMRVQMLSNHNARNILNGLFRLIFDTDDVEISDLVSNIVFDKHEIIVTVPEGYKIRNNDWYKWSQFNIYEA